MPYVTFSLRAVSDIAAEPQVYVDYTRRVFVTEAQLLAIQKAGGDGAGIFTEIPTINQIPVLNALVIASDQPVNLKLASVVAADGVIALKAGGILAVIDASIGAGAGVNATVNNPGTNAATLSGIAGGT